MYFELPLSTDPQRARLLAAMAVSVAQKGYADTTIADVVREASVSRRTFYEHFADKADCLLGLLEAGSELLLDELQAIDDRQAPSQTALVAGVVQRYYAFLARHPVLLRTLLLEVGLGPRAWQVRKGVNEQLAALLLAHAQAHPSWGNRPAPDPMVVRAAVGGVNELALLAIMEGREAELPALGEPAVGLLVAALHHHALV